MFCLPVVEANTFHTFCQRASYNGRTLEVLEGSNQRIKISYVGADGIDIREEGDTVFIKSRKESGGIVLEAEKMMGGYPRNVLGMVFFIVSVVALGSLWLFLMEKYFFSHGEKK